MMQFDQARQIPLEKILKQLGIQIAYASKIGEELWYLSPFRDEKTPSFKVDTRQNLWFDFGEGVGGSPIDLIAQVFNTNAHGALKILSDFENRPLQTKEKISPSVFVISKILKTDIFMLEKVDVLSNQNTSLHQYIVAERCIDVMIAERFLKTVYFKHTGMNKSFVAMGIENTEGGYEVRNPFFKGTIPESSKSFSWFQTAPGNEQVVCFEGLMDFLSYGTFFNWRQEDYLILNSTSNSKKALEFLNLRNYKKIKTFFDNDAAGEKATSLFQETFGNVEPQNAIFEGYSDFNAFLMGIKKSIS